MDHRCGRHAVLANPASQIPIWLDCSVHRSAGEQQQNRFDEIIALEFYGEEIMRLDWIVQHGMLD